MFQTVQRIGIVESASRDELQKKVMSAVAELFANGNKDGLAVHGDTPSMGERGVEPVLSVTFGAGGNDTPHLGAGWAGEEPGLRWMTGASSEFWIEHPGHGHDLVLELDIASLNEPAAGITRHLTVSVRGIDLPEIAVHGQGTVGFIVPASMLIAPDRVWLIFRHPAFRRSMMAANVPNDGQPSFACSALRMFRIISRPVFQPAPVLPPAEMVARFESLGENCEFGLVQRLSGAEPLGLLRFSFIAISQVLRGLRSGFMGLGDPGTVLVYTGEEYMIHETVYGMTYHTFLNPAELTVYQVEAQQTVRLKFLRRKLMEDIVAGEKIFVIKRNKLLNLEEVLPVYVALNELGRNWLLWVTETDDQTLVGTVEVVTHGLLRGHVDRFSPLENAGLISSFPAWQAICEASWHIVGGSVGTGARPGAPTPLPAPHIRKTSTPMNICVVTPYSQGGAAWLRQAHESVKSQTVPAHHILVCGGVTPAEIPDFRGTHIVSRRNYQDHDNTSRLIGCYNAITAYDADAIAFLEADHWYHPDHLRSLSELAATAPFDAVVSARMLHRTDGTAAMKCPVVDGQNRIDVSCIFVMKPAFQYFITWALLSQHPAVEAEQLLWHVIREGGARTAFVDEPTVAHRTK